jgi:hypothetical protein
MAVHLIGRRFVPQGNEQDPLRTQIEKGTRAAEEWIPVTVLIA